MSNKQLLYYARETDDASAVQAILQKYPNLLECENENGSTPLMLAAFHANDKIVRLLINRRANVNKQNRRAMSTALIYAAKAGHRKTVRMLLEGGSDFSLKNQDGLTARDVARKKGHHSVVDTLEKWAVEVRRQQSERAQLRRTAEQEAAHQKALADLKNAQETIDTKDAEIRQLRDELVIQGGTIDSDFKRTRLSNDSLTLVFRELASRRPMLSREQIENETHELEKTVPQECIALLQCSEPAEADTKSELPHPDLLKDIESSFAEYKKLQTKIGSYEVNQSQATLRDMLASRDAHESKLVTCMDTLCGLFGCDKNMNPLQMMSHTRMTIQRMRRLHEKLLDTEAARAVPKQDQNGNESVPQLYLQWKCVISDWLEEYIHYRVNCQEAITQQSKWFGDVLGNMASFATDDDAFELQSNTFGDSVQKAVVDMLSMFRDQEQSLSTFNTFPKHKFDAAHARFCNAVHGRLKLLKRIQRSVLPCGDTYALVKSRNRADYVQTLKSDLKELKNRKSKAKYEKFDAAKEVAAVENDDDRIDELPKVKALLEEANRKERRVKRECHEAMFVHLTDVKLYMPEVLVLAEYDNDRNVKLLREFHATDGVVLTDIDWNSFDEPPALILETSQARHSVYKGILNGVPYALKHYNVNDGDRLLKEVRLMKRLEHPYIAEVCFVMIDNSQYYEAMPYYEGGSVQHLLHEITRNGQQMDSTLLKHLMRQILLGVSHIHRQGIVHCDLKPDNIFLTCKPSDNELPTIKIGDFDVSKSDEERAALVTTLLTTMPAGGYTLEYVAPELLAPVNAKANTKSDMYSVGLCMFDMICGGYTNRPKDKVLTVDVLRRHVSDPGALEVLCSLLSPNPQHRASASEILTFAYFSEAEAMLQFALNEEHQRQQALLGGLFTCAICMNEAYEADGMHCPNGDISHFLCNECFTDKVAFDSKTNENNDLVGRRGEVFCVGYSMKNCECHKSKHPKPYDTGILARHVTVEVFQAVIKARGELLHAQFERDAADEVRKQLEEWRRMDVHGQKVIEARLHIVQTILTLRCSNPNGCRQAFLDFTGCFALECSRCSGHFCGWCLEWCDADAHAHVRQCPKRKSQDVYFGTEEEFEQSNRERRLADLKSYLPSLSKKVARDAVNSLSLQLRDLRLEEILTRFG